MRLLTQQDVIWPEWTIEVAPLCGCPIFKVWANDIGQPVVCPVCLWELERVGYLEIEHFVRYDMRGMDDRTDGTMLTAAERAWPPAKKIVSSTEGKVGAW